MSNAVVKLFLSCQLPSAKYKCDCVDVRIAEVVVHWTLSERLLILCPASCTNRQLYHPNIAECPLMCATFRERTTLDMFFKTDNLEAFCNITGNGKHQPAHTRHIKSVQIFPALKIFSDLRILNAAIHTKCTPVANIQWYGNQSESNMYENGEDTASPPGSRHEILLLPSLEN